MKLKDIKLKTCPFCAGETESAIYDEIVNAYMADDYESIEQCIYDITNIKVKEK